MTTTLLVLIILFFVIAVIYSSVGFGGGSSYLAILALSGISFEMIRPASLLCNIVVVTGGAIIFYKNGNIQIRRVLPFLLLSIPFAFVGGYWRISEQTFFILLGVTLIVAGILLWFHPEQNGESRSGNTALNSIIGGSVGFLSGLVGIGGGIFLSPILHFLRWDTAKKISGVATVFILVNSVSGLAGQLTAMQSLPWQFILPLAIAVFAGGQIGSRLGVSRLNTRNIKRVTAILIFVAGIAVLAERIQ